MPTESKLRGKDGKKKVVMLRFVNNPLMREQKLAQAMDFSHGMRRFLSLSSIFTGMNFGKLRC